MYMHICIYIYYIYVYININIYIYMGARGLGVPFIFECSVVGQHHLWDTYTMQNAENAENDILCCRNAEKRFRSHIERHQRQLH